MGRPRGSRRARGGRTSRGGRGTYRTSPFGTEPSPSTASSVIETSGFPLSQDGGEDTEVDDPNISFSNASNNNDDHTPAPRTLARRPSMPLQVSLRERIRRNVNESSADLDSYETPERADVYGEAEDEEEVEEGEDGLEAEEGEEGEEIEEETAGEADEADTMDTAKEETEHTPTGTVVPIRGISRGGRPRGRARGSRGRAKRGRGRGWGGGPGSRGGPGAYKNRASRARGTRAGMSAAGLVRRAASDDSEIEIRINEDGTTLNLEDGLLKPSTNFITPSFDHIDTLLRGKYEAIGDKVQLDALRQRQEELRDWFKHMSKRIMECNGQRSMDNYKALKRQPNAVKETEWFQEVLRKLERNEVAVMAKFERLNRFMQDNAAEITFQGQKAVERSYEILIAEVMDNAIREYIRFHRDISDFILTRDPFLIQHALDRCNVASVHDLSMGDLYIAFNPAGGRDRTRYDDAQIKSRSNQALYDRRVRETSDARVRRLLGTVCKREMAQLEREERKRKKRKLDNVVPDTGRDDPEDEDGDTESEDAGETSFVSHGSGMETDDFEMMLTYRWGGKKGRLVKDWTFNRNNPAQVFREIPHTTRERYAVEGLLQLSNQRPERSEVEPEIDMANTSEDVPEEAVDEQQQGAEPEAQPKTPPNGEQLAEAPALEDADASKATPTVGLFDHRHALAPQLKTPRETGIFDPPSPSPSANTPSTFAYDSETGSTPLDSVADQDSFRKTAVENPFPDQLRGELPARQNGSLGANESLPIYSSDTGQENGTQMHDYPPVNGGYRETLPVAPKPPIYVQPPEWTKNPPSDMPTNGFGQDAPKSLSNNIPDRLPTKQPRQSIRANRNNRPSTVKGFPGPDGIFVYESGIPIPSIPWKANVRNNTPPPPPPLPLPPRSDEISFGQAATHPPASPAKIGTPNEGPDANYDVAEQVARQLKAQMQARSESAPATVMEPLRKKRGRPRESRPSYSFKVKKQRPNEDQSETPQSRASSTRTGDTLSPGQGSLSPVQNGRPENQTSRSIMEAEEPPAWTLASSYSVPEVRPENQDNDPQPIINPAKSDKPASRKDFGFPPRPVPQINSNGPVTYAAPFPPSSMSNTFQAVPIQPYPLPSTPIQQPNFPGVKSESAAAQIRSPYRHNISTPLGNPFSASVSTGTRASLSPSPRGPRITNSDSSPKDGQVRYYVGNGVWKTGPPPGLPPSSSSISSVSASPIPAPAIPLVPTFVPHFPLEGALSSSVFMGGVNQPVDEPRIPK